MKAFRAKRPSPAVALSIVALFVALGGTGYAAIALPTNSVGTKQLKRNAVTSAKVKNGSIKRADLVGGALLRGAKGATGAKGGRGPAGTPGAPGTPGTDGTQMWVVITSAGTVTRASNPAITAAHVAPSGRYDVDFGTNVSACAWQASVGGQNTSPPPNSVVSTGNDLADPEKVVVFTDSPPGTITDRQFVLTVFC